MYLIWYWSGSITSHTLIILWPLSRGVLEFHIGYKPSHPSLSSLYICWNILFLVKAISKRNLMTFHIKHEALLQHHRIWKVSLVLNRWFLLHNRLSNNGFSWMWKYEPMGGEELNELLHASYSNYVFRFNLNSNGEYSIKSMRKLLDSKLILHKWQSICWSKLIMLKVCCFIRRAYMGSIPVTQELTLRGVGISNNLCPFCSKETETVDHILTSCEYTKVVIEWILLHVRSWKKLYVNMISNLWFECFNLKV